MLLYMFNLRSLTISITMLGSVGVFLLFVVLFVSVVSLITGPLSTTSSGAIWLNSSTLIRAGDQGSAEVLFVDAFNNSVASYINFTMYFLQNGQTFDDVSVLTRRQTGYQLINFVITVIGDYSLRLVYGSNTELKGSPLKFRIIPGSFSLCISIFTVFYE